jgi:hypothetical protein
MIWKIIGHRHLSLQAQQSRCPPILKWTSTLEQRIRRQSSRTPSVCIFSCSLDGFADNEAVMVVFQNDSNPQEPPQEAHVTGVPILVKNKDGGPTYSARLTDIFPEVFGQGDSMSPIKSEWLRNSTLSAAQLKFQSETLGSIAKGLLIPMAVPAWASWMRLWTLHVAQRPSVSMR